jgi:hypothetical protein
MLALLAPAGARASNSTADMEKQILALKHQMDLLARQNAAQQHRIEQLERRVVAHAAPKRTQRHHARRAIAAAPVKPPALSPVAQFASETTMTQPAPEPAQQQQQQQGGSGYIGKQGPTQGSVQTVYEQQNALFNKGLTITPGVTYTYGDSRFFTLNGFMALGAIFLGNINVSRQQNSVVSPNVNLTYAPNKRMQFDMTVPFVLRESSYSSAGAQDSSQQVSERTVRTAGIGDINAGLFYQLPQRRLNGPIVVLNGHVTIPTGSTPYGIKVAQDANNSNISYASTLPTGIGVWAVSAGASVIKTLDPAILFAGVNAYYPIQKHFSDISPYQGTVQPGQVAPGSALSLSVGTAFSLNDKMSATFSFQDTVVGSERIHGDGGPWQTVGGSSMNAGVFNIGTTYSINHHESWQAMLGIGVTQDAPNFQFSMRFPHGP